MTTIYVDSRKRVAGSDSDFEVDLGESLHLQSDARLAVYKIRLADSFLSTDRGRYLYWVDAALGTLNWALLPEGAYTGARLAAWISSNFATATYSETTNSLSVAYDGLNDLELRNLDKNLDKELGQVLSRVFLLQSHLSKFARGTWTRNLDNCGLPCYTPSTATSPSSRSM